MVDTAIAPRVAPQQPPDRQPAPHHGATGPQCRHCVGTAGRVVPAGRRGVWGDEPLIEPDRRDQQASCGGGHDVGRPAGRTPCLRRAEATPARRSTPRSRLVATAAAGNARITRSVPEVSPDNSACTNGRSRLVTRCRTTALPTLADTTKPARGSRSAPVRSRCTTREAVPARRPERTTEEKSSEARRRLPAGSMGTGTSGRQADSSSRPLRRRAARMARPARVRIRSRNPWVLARRRLFGWKVRLLTAISPLSVTAHEVL